MFIENHAILSTCQFDFREHHSTSMALTKLVDKITHELDNKCYSVGIFKDLSKAFDTIDHNILIKKLQCVGFLWYCCRMSNKLSIWSWVVCLNKWSSFNHFIDAHRYSAGIYPGPSLFILYINDIVNISNDAELLLFADDTNVFLYDTDIYQLSVHANKTLSDVNNLV